MGHLARIAAMTAVLLAISGCAAGIRGGIVSPDSEEAVPEPQEITFVYDGERGTVVGLEMPDYRMARIEFNDVIVSMRVPPGWSAERYGMAIRLENEELGGVIMIHGSAYPDLEVASVHDAAQNDEDVEVSPLALELDARRATTFAIATMDGQSVMFLGILTNARDPGSGVIVAGQWPSANSDRCRLDLLFIADSITISENPARSCAPSG